MSSEACMNRLSWTNRLSLALIAALVMAGQARGEAVDRVAAEKAAVADGRVRLQEQVWRSSLDKDWTVGKLLQRLGRERALDAAVAAADLPGGVRWLDERTCQVNVRLAGQKASDALIEAATAARDPQVDPRWVRQATAGWVNTAFTATGSNVQLPTGPATAGTIRAQLPDQPPRWVFGLADAEAVARSNEGGLKTARLAEKEALAVLREQVRGLEISPRVTLGAMADGNPAIAASLESAMRCARVYKTEYHADGSVLVRMSLNLRLLWAELDAAR